MGKRKRRLWHETPWDGQRGFWPAWRRFFYQFEGPSQLGDRHEAPYVPPADPKCPMCGITMKEHRFLRGGPGLSTRVVCPKPDAH